MATSPGIPLNEGRGSHPGDTRPVVNQVIAPALNEGRGSHPGDTPGDGRLTSTSHGDTIATRLPLNEGRGSHPGDTRLDRGRWDAGGCAQRRPGLPPRRHGESCTGRRAQRRPGLPPRRHVPSTCTPENSDPRTAQRRPGLPPRRHVASSSGALDVRHVRSTKAGAPTPATLPARSRQRSTKAGAPTPATPEAAVRSG